MTTADLKRGQVIQIDNAPPCMVMDVTSQSPPSARGGSTLVKTKYRNLLTSQVLVKNFKGGDRVEEADFERRKGQFLYASTDGGGVFMDLQSYEQYELGGEDIFEPVKGYLLEGLEVLLGVFQENVIYVELPMVVELTVTETAPPAIKNATATAQTKEATLETGFVLQVPGYLESGS